MRGHNTGGGVEAGKVVVSVSCCSIGERNPRSFACAAGCWEMFAIRDRSDEGVYGELASLHGKCPSRLGYRIAISGLTNWYSYFNIG